MKTFSYSLLTLADVCDHNDIEYAKVMDAICDSDISFGNNYDTIMSSKQLEDILENAGLMIDGLDYDNHDEDGFVLISLGS